MLDLLTLTFISGIYIPTWLSFEETFVHLIVIIYMINVQRGVSRNGDDTMSRKGCCRGGICRICPLVSDLSFLCPSYDTILVQFLLLVDSNTKIVPSFVSLYLSDSFPVQFCKLDLDQLKAHSVIHRLCQKCSKLSL